MKQNMRYMEMLLYRYNCHIVHPLCLPFKVSTFKVISKELMKRKTWNYLSWVNRFARGPQSSRQSEYIPLHCESTLSKMSQKRCWESSTLYGAVLFRSTPPRTTMHRNAPRTLSLERTRPWQSALDLFAVSEIKGPIIEFFGKLLPLRPGNRAPRLSERSWPLSPSPFSREFYVNSPNDSRKPCRKCARLWHRRFNSAPLKVHRENTHRNKINLIHIQLCI